MKIGNKFIQKGYPCFIIAEAGVNHNGDIGLAKKLIDAAKEARADAVKFQTFQTDALVTPGAEQAEYQTRNSGTKGSQHEMLKKLELSYSDLKQLKEYCDERAITFLSTPHSCKEDVDMVATVCPAIKVGSGDLTNFPILQYIAQKDLPMIVSTGMATLEEVREAVEIILPINKKLILLHCTTNYPTPFHEVNLKAMQTMEKEFQLPVGYSDHTEGITISLAAAALGACVIEKHFTLERSLPGPDHKASLEPEELTKMIAGIRDIERGNGKELNVSEAMGSGVKRPTKNELEIAKTIRKSIVAAVAVRKGETITQEMLAIKRPGTGVAPKYLNKVLGKKAKARIQKNEVITWDSL